MYKRNIWRHPSRAQKRNHRCMPVPGSAKKKSVISYLSTERVFRTVGHRKYIVVPYVVTYAVPLRTRTYAYTIVKTKILYTIPSSICCLKKTGF